MQRFTLFLVFILTGLNCYSFANNDIDLSNKLKGGDIIFQVTTSAMSRAIQKATKSKYSHVGIIFFKKEKPFVLEAVQPVKYTKLKYWINRGENRHFVVKRLKEFNKYMSKSNIKTLKKAGEKYLGKDYDDYFQWSDKRIYCSELVWKIYKKVLDIKIGRLKRLKDFALKHKIVKNYLKIRFGKKIPFDERIIAPVDMFNSKKLKTVIIKN